MNIKFSLENPNERDDYKDLSVNGTEIGPIKMDFKEIG
jgi:hypothetical protein